MKIQDFESFCALNEQNEKAGTICKYRWRESFNNIYHETKCEVLSHNDKTAVIKLLEFGKDGRRPGTQMRVQLKSLVGFETREEHKPDDRWKGYTYFD